MRTSLVVFFLAAGACLSAQVRFTKDAIDVNVDGKPFSTFHYGTLDANKPYLSPLRSASGKVVTRLFPMETVEGESRDHMHHRGLWIAYKGVNDINFWENDPSYTERGKYGKIVVRKAEFKQGDKAGTLTAVIDWNDPNGKTLLVEDRTMTFYSDPKLRTIDILCTLTAGPEVTFLDAHDGLLGIRLAEPFTERKGGVMVNAEGLSTMLKAWGKRSNWIDYTGVVDGEKLGVAIFDNPKNLNYPTYWHARDYGLVSANPLARNAFDSSLEEAHFKLAAGQKWVFRWRVIIHPGDAATAHVADMYKEYLAAKP
jgi:hypothetical protein